MRVRLRSFWLFVVEPWRSLGIAVALVGSLSLPAALLSSGPMFEQSASDAISVGVLEEVEPAPAGLNVAMNGAFTDDVLEPLSQSIEQRLVAIEPLAPPVRTMISKVVKLDAGLDSGRASRVNLFARPGAIQALDVVSGEQGAPGLWISSFLASETGLEPGDSVVLEGTTEALPIAGVYRDLWDGDPAAYWDSVPDEFMPTFSRVFNSTLRELAVVDEELVSRVAGGGRVIWQADLDHFPTTYDGLRSLDAAYRSVERAFSGETVLAQQYRAAAEDPNIPPGVFTAVDAAVVRARALIAELEQPIRTTTLAGAAAGVLLSTLGAVFMIRRRRNEYRLHAADGDQWWRFFGRGLAQYTLPAIAGIAHGIGVAYAAIVAFGPSGTAELAAIPLGDVVRVTVLACVLAALVTALLAIRLADGIGLPEPGRGWMFLIVGAAVAMWFQVGRDDAGDVNPLVVAFPFVGILAGVVVVVVGLRLLLRAVRRTGAELPTPLFLAWRALTASEGGALLLTATLGMATGLAVLSTSFVTSADTATADKAATTVGSTSRVELRTSAADAVLPDRSTIVRTQDTNAGNARARVIAVDPATFADAVLWPSSFGSSPSAILEALDQPLDGAVPVVLIDGGEGDGGVPRRGELGSKKTFPYEVVATIGSFPLASDSAPTFAVRADRLEEFARQRFDAGNEPVDEVAANTAEALGRELGYESPLVNYRATVVSQATADEVTASIEGGGGRVGDTMSLSDQIGNPETQATRWAVDFLRILALIGGITAITALALYLAERRREREVAAAMTAQMGVAGRTNILAAVIEMVGLATVALAAGSVCAVVTARRVFPSFDPDPRIPPTTSLSVSVSQVLAIALVVLVAVAVTAAWVQRSANASSKSRVLRG
ncbi:MAG: hypothetical protein ABWZ99_00475 [Ilumatobacteraceae bacterium]